MVDFATVPASTRVPRFLTEVSSTRASLGDTAKPFRLLVVGQRTSSGNVAELVPTRIRSVSEARDAFGDGSILHGMARTLFANNVVTDAYFVAQDDAGAGTQGTQTLTVTGPATAAGNVYLYIAGRRILVAVANADAQNDIATAIAAAVNAVDNLPMTAGAATNVVTLTARNDGTLGNAIDVRLNRNDGEALPAGVGVAIATGVTGANDPDITAVWPVLGDVQYDVLAVSYTDQTNLTAVTAELQDRFEASRQIPGVAMIGVSDTASNLGTLGTANAASKHLCLLGSTNSPTPPWEWGAAVAGIVAQYGQADPARQFRTLVLDEVLAPDETDRYTFTEQETLLGDGVATWEVNALGEVAIQRLITTFQTDELGSPSTAFLDVNTGLTLSFMRYDFARIFTTLYPRHKLADSGTRFGADQAVLTPAIAAGQAVAIFRRWEELGLMENVDQAKQDLVVERSSSDPNRLEFLLSPDLINNARIFAAQIAFIL